MGYFSARSTLVALVMLRATVPGQAAEPFTPADTPLSDADIGQRIDFIGQRLDSHATHGQIWYWSWMTINGGSMVGQAIAAGLSEHGDDQVQNGVQAGLGAIGVADLLLRPLQARHGADPIRGLPEDTREEKIAKLRAAESRLCGNARRAEERTSWPMYAGNLAVNGVAGLIIGVAGRPSDGLIAFGTGHRGRRDSDSDATVGAGPRLEGLPAAVRRTGAAPPPRPLCGGACWQRRAGRRPLVVVSAAPPAERSCVIESRR